MLLIDELGCRPVALIPELLLDALDTAPVIPELLLDALDTTPFSLDICFVSDSVDLCKLEGGV